MLEHMFKLRERGTTVRTEVLGGITTFVAMAYIIVVNPAILSFAGLPVGPSTVATILAASVGSLLMGLYANRPIAVAPYMGENARIAVGVLMIESITKIRFDDMTELAPAFATIVIMVFTYNIGNGLTAGLVLYPLMKLAGGRYRELNGGAIVLGLLCLFYYLFGLPH
ncbi:MAG: hypothetical protein HYV04_16450 [Deltaproteobacteria bacterium]|nr:hypothetical protein [Deltaproteobacteria bacterium]